MRTGSSIRTMLEYAAIKLSGKSGTTVTTMCRVMAISRDCANPKQSFYLRRRVSQTGMMQWSRWAVRVSAVSVTVGYSDSFDNP